MALINHPGWFLFPHPIIASAIFVSSRNVTVKCATKEMQSCWLPSILVHIFGRISNHALHTHIHTHTPLLRTGYGGAVPARLMYRSLNEEGTRGNAVEEVDMVKFSLFISTIDRPVLCTQHVTALQYKWRWSTSNTNMSTNSLHRLRSLPVVYIHGCTFRSFIGLIW